jgi:ribose-phosphate pyrophosphokinase
MSTMNLYLDPAFRPTGWSCDVAYEAMTFSGGEEHVKLVPGESLKTRRVWISHRLTSGNAFLRFAMAVDAVRNAGGNPCGFLAYVPYARQDRIMVEGEPLSIRVFAELLNSLRLDSLRIFDPHSDVTPALLRRLTVLDNSRFIRWVFETALDMSNTVIVAPDAGALKKIYALCTKIGYTGDVVVGSKLRDVNNGKIIRQSIDGEVAGRDCLIVDDIIDGGRTFQDLAALLRERGATSVRLAVSHGIFSQGTKHLRGPLDDIYVTNSFRDMHDRPADADFVHQYQLSFEG